MTTVDEIDSHKDYFKDHDYYFSCFGTTRGDAGGAKEFHKIDHGFNVKCAQFAKDNGIKYCGLVSAMNANKNAWIQYGLTKGLIEEDLTNMKFNSLLIYRPGILDRGDKARLNEKIGGFFMSPISVRTIAKAMRINAENTLEGKNPSDYEGVKFYDNKEIKKTAI